MEAVPSPLDQPFRVGAWRLHPVASTATHAGYAVSVEPRVMAVLTYLAHHAGRIVSRDELLDAVWTGVVVNEDALTRAVSEGRKLFDDDPRAPAVIETIRGRGYRLVAPVTFEDTALENAVPDQPEAAAPRPDAASRPARAWLIWGTGLLAAAAVLAVAGAVWTRSASSLSASEPSASASAALPVAAAATPFTSYPGREITPAVSPEGARVAFAWDNGEGDNFDLYVKQSSREEPLQLTDGPGYEGDPAWSPDGAEIAFYQDGAQQDGTREAGAASGIYTIPSMGGPRRLVFSTPHEVESMDWSPDGQTLVFAVPVRTGGPSVLHLLDFETGEARPLTPAADAALRDRSPRFSPGGARIAFVRSSVQSRGQVLLLDVETAAVTPAAGYLTAAHSLDWIDDQALVLSSYHSGTYDLWRLDLGTGALTWLPTRGEWTFSPSVAAQSGALVYQDLYFEKNVWRIRLDGPGGQVVGTEPLVTSSWLDCEAQLSPEGERLVFVSSRSGAMELWLSDADGRAPVQLTQFEGAFVSFPRWSPDGRQVAFDAAPDGPASVFVLDVRSGQQRRLSPEGWNVRLSGWTPDGAAVYFSAQQGEGWELWRVPAEGGRPTQVSQHHVLSAAASADGRTLYFTRFDRPGLWRSALVDGHTSEEAELVLPGLTRDHAFDWALTDGGLYALERREAGTYVLYHDLETGRSRTVTEVTRIATPSLAVSGDGATLLYGRAESARSDVLYQASVR